MRQTKVSSSEGILGRLVCSVPEDLIQAVQRTLLDSMSAFVEVAIRELLSRQDVLDVLRRYDASAKRVITKRGKLKS
jgi:hypothetical protein